MLDKPSRNGIPYRTKKNNWFERIVWGKGKLNFVDQNSGLFFIISILKKERILNIFTDAITAVWGTLL